MTLPPLLWNAAFPSPITWLRAAGGLLIALLVSLTSGCGKQEAAAGTPAAAAQSVAVVSAASAPKPASPKPFYAMMAERRPNIPALTALGKALFFDPALSASGKQSCASCHSPDHAYGPPNDLSVQLGGVDMSRTGVRAAPSLRYVQNVPAYTDHYHENDGNDAEDQGPTGGHNWDGRANSAHEQARIPLLSPHEMANGEPRVVVEKIRKGPHAETFRKVLGQDVLDDDDTAFNVVLMALEVFQETPSEFYPYTSKYDAVLRGQAKLTPRRHAACASSTIRTRATAPRAIRAIFARAHSRLSRISDSSPWVRHAIASLPAMPIQNSTIWGSAARIAPISRIVPTIAACSGRRHCATLHCVMRFSTMVYSILWTRCCTSTPNAM